MKQAPKRYDPAHETPMLQKSVCTGETLAGFYDDRDRRFHDVCLVRTQRDLARFRKDYGIEGEIRVTW